MTPCAFSRLFLGFGFRLPLKRYISINACIALQVRNIEANTDENLVDPHGHPLPPCIVMERGEPLDVWAARALPDRPQAFVVRPSFSPKQS
jgi:hypothetical protein